MALKLYETETGETIENVASYITEEQKQAIDKKRANELETAKKELSYKKTNKHFNFTSMEKGGTLKKLSLKHLGYLLVLQTYTDYKNMLRIPDGKKPMKKSDIKRAIHVTDSRSLNAFLDAVMDLGIIYEEQVLMYGKEHKAYFVSADYCFKKGTTSPHNRKKTTKTAKIFTEELQKIYESKQVKPADIGLIYRCIQYLHYETNSLVRNPYEQDLAYVEYFTMESLTEELGMTQQALSKKLNALKYPMEYNGETILLNVFGRFKAGNTVTYKMNPLLAYRKIGEPTVQEYDIFLVEYFRDKRKSESATLAE